MTLPLPLRNWLAELIVEAFHDGPARARLGSLRRYCQGDRAGAEAAGFPAELFGNAGGSLTLKDAYRRFEDELCERVARGWTAVGDRAGLGDELGLSQALDRAAALFDARLDFEVHELLEPFWLRAQGETKEALQGLIQVAVGFHHLATGNPSGARMLLEEGSARLRGRRLDGTDLDPFARQVQRALQTIAELGPAAPAEFDWSHAPRFPRPDQRVGRAIPCEG